MLTWLDKFQMHWLYGIHVLAHDGVDGPSTLKKIPPDASNQSFVGIRVQKDLNIHEITKRLINKDQNPLHDNDFSLLKPAGLFEA